MGNLTGWAFGIATLGLPSVAPWAWFWLQAAVFVLLLVGLLYLYWDFKGPFCRLAVGHLGLSALLVLVYLLLYGLLGTGFGIPYLFWHEDFLSRVGAAMGVTLLLGVLGIIAYYLDPFPLATERRTKGWLQADEHLKASLQSWWWRKPLGEVDGPAVSARDRVVFASNAILLDPISLLFIQRGLDPKWPNQVRLQRFLRTCRTPFLWLVLAPAVLPGFFVNVPRSAPTWPGWDAELGVGDTWGYLLGLIAWVLGVWAGVFLIKILVRVSELRYYAIGLMVRAGARTRWSRGAWLERLRRTLARSEPAAGRQHPDCSFKDCPGAGCPFGEPAHGRHPPGGCKGRREFSLSVWMFFAVFAAVYVFMAANSSLQEKWVTPAFAICALLAILAMIYAGFSYLPRIVTTGLTWVAARRQEAAPTAEARQEAAPGRLARVVESIEAAPRLVQVPTVALLAVWLCLVNSDPFRNRYEALSYDPASVVDLRYRADDSYFASGGAPSGSDSLGLVSDAEVLCRNPTQRPGA